MGTTSYRFAWYLAVLQLFFALCWTIYVIYLPKLAAAAEIAPKAVILVLMLDQAVFTICDFATGIAADLVTRVLGRLGVLVTATTALSCAAFLLMPLIASAGAPIFIAVIVVWTVTSSALRAPPLMLLGKYARKPSIPYLSALALLGTGIAGAIGPYLTTALRDIDPRIPFALASIVLMLVTLGMIKAERILAEAPHPTPTKPPVRSFGNMTRPAIAFALVMITLALGYQLHFALDSAPLFLRFTKADQLQWLMPVFWIGFNLSMFPAGVVTNRLGGYRVMGGAALIGALGILAAHLAQGLGQMVVAQFAAGAAWGAILMSAFSVAFAIGENGGEGRMSGLLFSALAIATLARMATIATGFNTDPSFKAVLQWLPTMCWTVAGLALLYLAAARMKRWIER
ncbi:MAG TPA: MFS transporter [Pseudolabrys sp.]|nr:MFS transporter [Pseudolabrys sp.]